jgi:homoserine dehydrogenase
MNEVGIGLLGLGTVGGGVADGLTRNGNLIAERIGVRLALRAIADVDPDRDRGVAFDRSLLTRDAAAVVRDPRCAVIVETIGGTDIARELILQALDLGKPVVTANKALLAHHGAELFERARRNRTGLFFEASVGGGIPIIRALQEGLVANEFESIVGILNGTCNYILTQMEETGAPFEAVLAEAQRAGFAEADPTLDLDGHDAAHKTCILASLAFGRALHPDRISTQGIRAIQPRDISYAAELGYRIKMLSVIRRHREQAEVAVYPALVPVDHVLSSVGGVFNAILVLGDLAGPTLYYGRGAGRYPTASSVIGDVADAASRVLTSGPWNSVGFVAGEGRVRLRDPGLSRGRYYLRLTLRDDPGILARVALILGAHDISLATVIQHESGQGGLVPVILLTHLAPGRSVAAAAREIDALQCVGAPSVCFRIEDFQSADRPARRPGRTPPAPTLRTQ